jgi:lipoprotein signal peptidase
MQKKHILTYGLSLLLLIINMPQFSVFGIYSGLGAAVLCFAMGLVFASLILLFKKPKPNILQRVNLALIIGVIITVLIRLTPKH